ncbi:MAG: aspartyl-phosphate phosphatase Spo0E family protein [Candidatus Carbobacillus altaicus]|nr:aspartyl-phosphate phosphatase Spo0E family protein [Candidatus Carbobacillus altaicus]
MSRMKTLEQDIQALRQKMVTVFRQSGSYTDPELLHISRKLDEKLNDWQAMYAYKKQI